MVIADPVSDGGTLIERLARITMDQSGEDLTDIDPCTGALRRAQPNNKGTYLHNVDAIFVISVYCQRKMCCNQKS